MADVHNKKTRSYNMSKIRSKDTKPELIVRKYLHGKGLRYRLHEKKLPGSPDIVFPKYKKALFVNGCFWHGHENCRLFKLPKTRSDWWKSKIFATRDRDKLAMKELIAMGWTPIEVFECELKKGKRDETLKSLYNMIVDEENSNN